MTTNKPLLFVVGDSISIGYGTYLEQMIAPTIRYARKTGMEAALHDAGHPAGPNGGDSFRLLQYLQALHETGDFSASILALNCGLHDLKCDRESGKNQVSLRHYQANLEKIFPLAKRLADRVLWVRTTPVDEVRHRSQFPFDRVEADVDAYNEIADAAAALHAVPTADLFTFSAALDLNDESFRDGVHFSPELAAQQAAFLSGRLSVL